MEKTDNEIIAEFMGLPLEKDEVQFTGGTKKVPFQNWQYDTSWDWLMPVVEKLQEPEVKKGRIVRESANIQIFYKNCFIEYIDEELDATYDLHPNGVQGETKLEATYKAIVEFIKWYNSEKK